MNMTTAKNLHLSIYEVAKELADTTNKSFIDHKCCSYFTLQQSFTRPKINYELVKAEAYLACIILLEYGLLAKYSIVKKNQFYNITINVEQTMKSYSCSSCEDKNKE